MHGDLRKDGVVLYQGEYWDIQHLHQHWRTGSDTSESVRLEVYLRRDKDPEEEGNRNGQ